MPWFRDVLTVKDALPPQVLTLRRGDRLPAFSGIVQDENGDAVNISASKVFMTLRPLGANVPQPEWLVRLPMFIESGVGGRISYDWQHLDTIDAPACEYDALIEVEYNNGTKISAPSASMNLIVSIRPSPTSDWFFTDTQGFMVVDGDGNFVRTADVMLNEDGSPHLTEAGEYIIVEEA